MHTSTSSRPPPLFIAPVYQSVRVPTQPGGGGWGVGGAQRMSDKTCSVLPRHLSEPRLSCAGMEMSRSDTTRQIGAGAPAGSLVICRFSLFRCFSSRLLFINRLHPSARHTCRSAHCASAARRFCAASPQTWPTEAAVSVQTVA